METRHQIVQQIDIETGEVIAEFKTTREAERKTNLNQSNISKVCRGERNQYAGFIWKYCDKN